MNFNQRIKIDDVKIFLMKNKIKKRTYMGNILIKVEEVLNKCV